MLLQNVFNKYFIYAIGEIVLVVIGILIALGINQRASFWTERKEEVIILQEIRGNLDSDLFEINDDLRLMDTIDIACDFIIEFIKKNEIPNPEFGLNTLKLRTTPHFNANLSGYKLLSSIGIKIIQNDTLRKVISDHFDSDYPYYKNYEQERIEFRIHTIEPQLVEHFSWVSKPQSLWLGSYDISDEDYRQLRNERKFEKLVMAIKRENNIVQNRANRIKDNILSLTQLLDSELDRRSKTQ